MSYYFSTTLFYHTHHFQWGTVTHSHPYIPFEGGMPRIPIRPNSARRSVCCRQSFCGSLSLRLFFSQGRSLRRFMFSFRGTFRTFVCLAFCSGPLLFSFAGDLPTGFRKSRFLRKFVPERKKRMFFIIRANEKNNFFHWSCIAVCLRGQVAGAAACRRPGSPGGGRVRRAGGGFSDPGAH